MGVILHLDDIFFQKLRKRACTSIPLTAFVNDVVTINPLLTWTLYNRFTLNYLRASSTASFHVYTKQVRVACSCPCARTITTRP